MSDSVIKATQIGHLTVITVTALAVRMLVLLLPLKRYQNMLGTHLGICDYSPLTSNNLYKKAQVYGDLTHRVCNRLPVGGDCLVAALTFARYAKRKGIPYVIHLGVHLQEPITSNNHNASTSTSKPQLAAHAWTCVHDAIVTGDGQDLAQFKIVSSFCNPAYSPNDR